jgi:RNA polymerase sigma factor (sigma-70 family)
MQTITLVSAPDDGVRRPVRGARHVTAASFDEFFRAHRADAVRWAAALVGDRAVAEELAQDSLAAVSARFTRLDNPGGYLRRVVVNRCASWHRSHARELRRMRRATAGQASSYTPETNEMLGALAALPYKQRAAVTLRFWADWTDEQIADALDCAPATVRVLVHRSLTALRVELREEPGTGARAAAERRIERGEKA